MKNTFILCAFLALSSFTVAQQSEKYPLGDYTELTDTKPHDSDAITTNFVRYVMTDELNKDRKGGCGHRENKAEWDSSVVADVLDIVKIRDIKARTTQPIWMNIWVPQSAKAGKYKGTLTVTGKNASPMELQIEVDVLNRTLPAPKDWAFHLDLWQNPYSVARSSLE